MIKINNKTKLPIYGISYGYSTYWKLIRNNDNELICSTYISWFDKENNDIEIKIHYNYDVPDNTYNYSDATKISKKEFDKFIKKVNDKFNIEFTIL